jgi:hypothetical protein
LGDLRTGQWREIAQPGVVLELAGWMSESGRGLVLTGLGAKPDEARQAYLMEPGTGELTPLDAIPREFTPGPQRSPDGRYSAEVIGNERLAITEAGTAGQRQFTFHPYDRHYVLPDSVHWVSSTYLVFHSARTSLINADSLKMNYPATKESGVSSIEFSPDFKLALGLKADGAYLGRVVLGNGQGE